MLLLCDKIAEPFYFATCFLQLRIYKLEGMCTSNLLFDFSETIYKKNVQLSTLYV